MKNNDFIKIKVLNWKKHSSKRKDYDHPYWFKFENKFFDYLSVKPLRDKSIVIYLYILCLASKLGSDDGIVCLSASFWRQFGGKKAAIWRQFGGLLANGYIEIIEESGKIRNVDKIRLDKIRIQKKNVVKKKVEQNFNENNLENVGKESLENKKACFSDEKSVNLETSQKAVSENKQSFESKAILQNNNNNSEELKKIESFLVKINCFGLISNITKILDRYKTSDNFINEINLMLEHKAKKENVDVSSKESLNAFLLKYSRYVAASIKREIGIPRGY